MQLRTLQTLNSKIGTLVLTRLPKSVCLAAKQKKWCQSKMISTFTVALTFANNLIEVPDIRHHISRFSLQE